MSPDPVKPPGTPGIGDLRPSVQPTSSQPAGAERPGGLRAAINILRLYNKSHKKTTTNKKTFKQQQTHFIKQQQTQKIYRQNTCFVSVQQPTQKMNKQQTQFPLATTDTFF